ncbi:hypothetical protein Y032_0019g3872 [Ancylostoma ceylanicum]|uniref:Uncharacterized protein n=1 Tax=Ancylostoma ceylanicum TaxID=53326 RepID=A0A016V247_9BILA|nr:hypothetical protein Y032_0019g3872 [Ancylostoma ceylanicum]
MVKDCHPLTSSAIPDAVTAVSRTYRRSAPEPMRLSSTAHGRTSSPHIISSFGLSECSMDKNKTESSW